MSAFNIGYFNVYKTDKSDKMDKQYINIFSPGLGCFKLGLTSIKFTNGDVTPKFICVGPIPFALKVGLKNEMENVLKKNSV